MSFTINAIQQAGIEDKNFAQAIYDSILSQPNRFLDGNTLNNNTYSSIEELLNQFNGDILANRKNIKSIEGISMLKSSTSIDISYNEIKNIKPLSVTDAIEAVDVSQSAQKYYGTKGKATHINIFGNPIQELPVWIGGRVEISPELTTSPVLLNDTAHVIVMEDSNKDIKYTVTIPIQNLYVGNTEPEFFEGNIFDGISIDYDDQKNLLMIDQDFTNAILATDIIGNVTEVKIKNITNSGMFHTKIRYRSLF